MLTQILRHKGDIDDLNASSVAFCWGFVSGTTDRTFIWIGRGFECDFRPGCLRRPRLAT